MTSPINFYAEPTSFAALKKGAADQDPKALREAARQFESIFTQMMLKSMRDANKTFASTDSPLSSEQGDFYREMFDNQIAMQLSKGKGLGLADLLVKQLQAKGTSATPDASSPKSLAPKSLTPENKSFELSPSKPASFPVNKNDVVAPITIEKSATPTSSSTSATPVTQTDAIKDRPSRVARIANSPEEFVAQLWPHAQAAGKELGVDPRTLIAHAALETGWGKNIPCNPDGTCSFNLFGIKASGRWHGSAVGVNTIEYENGVAVQKRASFRAYDSVADSFRDYASLIKSNPRYTAALQSGSDATAFASALQQGGYATDPNYASKLASVADRLHVAFKSDAHRPLAFGRSVSSGEVRGGET